MRRYSTAETRNHAPLPIVGYDFSAGLHVVAPKSGTAGITIEAAGAYLVTAVKSVCMSGSGSASIGPGSTYLAAGLPFHVMLDAGEISFFGVDDESPVFIVPVI